jgi:hypothetical protein
MRWGIFLRKGSSVSQNEKMHIDLPGVYKQAIAGLHI